jgi:hypothetical protein
MHTLYSVHCTYGTYTVQCSFHRLPIQSDHKQKFPWAQDYDMAFGACVKALDRKI